MNLSHAYAMASASFTICAYLCSFDVKACDAYATGFHSPHTFCKIAAPSPNDDESAHNIVSVSIVPTLA